MLDHGTFIPTEGSERKNPERLHLDPKPHTWHHTIIDRWCDLLEPDQPVHLHVVLPNPPGESLEPAVHVILHSETQPTVEICAADGFLSPY